MTSTRRVVTLTLHPAIDRVVRIQSLRPGDTFDGRLELAVPAGKGVNTARALKAICGSATAVVAATWLGADEAAWFKKRLFELSAVRAAIQKRPVPTRFAHTFLDVNGGETHIKEAMASPSAEEQKQFLAFWKKTVRKGDVVAVCGSAPAGVEPPVLNAIFRIARELGAHAIVADTHGAALDAAFGAGIDVVKGNAAEIGLWLKCGGPFDGNESRHREHLDATLRGKNAPKRIVITLGSKGALIADSASIHVDEPPKLGATFTRVSATGCGDAATAGILWSILEGDIRPEQMLDRAAACGTAKLSTADPGELSAKWVRYFLREMQRHPRD